MAIPNSSVTKRRRHDALMSLAAAGRPELGPHVQRATDWDTIREFHCFLRDETTEQDLSWGNRLARRYYEKLYKEFALADLSRYREGKVGLRWRTEAEVVTGKGQLSCANKRCDKEEGLVSYELPFAYTERGDRKSALVKVRVCVRCAERLFYKKLCEHRKRTSSRKRRSSDSAARSLKRTKKEREPTPCGSSSYGNDTIGRALDAMLND